jgi:hypothetical protein
VIRNQRQANVTKVYISAILDPIIGIGNTRCLALLTHLYPCNYEVNGGVPDSIQVETTKESPNEEVENSDPYQCDIMPSSSDEDKTVSITYLKKNTDPSLN